MWLGGGGVPVESCWFQDTEVGSEHLTYSKCAGGSMAGQIMIEYVCGTLKL